MRNAIIAILLGSVIAGCASTAKYEARLNTWIGESVDDLVPVWGIPTSTFEMKNHQKMYQYVSNGGSRSFASYNDFTNSASSYTVSYWCKTTFLANEKGIIINWSWEGNACKSR
jgi:hypothetical protein